MLSDGLMLTDLEKDVIMALEYDFPFTETPYIDIASKLDIPFAMLIDISKKLLKAGVIKRIGFNVNYKAFNKIAALVAVRAHGETLNKLKSILNSDKEVTHNYIRNHPYYNVWFVTKRKNVEELLNDIINIMKRLGLTNDDYLILLGKRTFKLSVKFDIKNGISWSQPDLLPEKIPSVEEFNINKDMIKELARGIPLEERPYKNIATKYGLKEDEIVSTLHELYLKRVIRNVGATLEGPRAGILYDGMVVLKGDEKVCEKIALNIPEATHVVYRVPLNGKWEYPAYFMTHARTKEQIERIAKHANDITGASGYMILYSLENLKPSYHVIE
ncbi:MAG: Lrp/AsnC family transcriptional regulator [Thermoprotei archaeon]|jgi:DNA-binding Lrp family transcriptional regulator